MKKAALLGMVLILLFLFSSCRNAAKDIENFDVEKAINSTYDNISPIMQVDKILYKKSINSQELIVFYLNKKQGINIARVAYMNDKWQCYLAANNRPDNSEVVSWAWSLISDPTRESNYKVGAVTHGYVNDPLITRVTVGIENKKDTYKEAEIQEFDIDGKKVKFYYCFFENTLGFETSVIAYDEDDNIIYNNDR